MVSGNGQRGRHVPVPGKGFSRTGSCMIHRWTIVQASLKADSVLSNVMQQPGEVAIRFRTKGRGKSGSQFRCSPQVFGDRLLASVVRDMCKIFHTSPPNDFRIASGVSDKQDNYAQPVGNGRKPWKLRAVFQKDPADYII